MPKSANRNKVQGKCANKSLTKTRSIKKSGGGTAAGGGINFQAAVTAIAGVHLMRGTPIGLLPVADVPGAVWAESEGAGDDVRVELTSGLSAEIQVKKGLKRSQDLWESLEALIKAVLEGQFDYGALAVAPDSSLPVRKDLAKDLERLGEGRHDHLTDIGAELHRRLNKIGGEWERACQRVSIRVVNALKVDDADIRMAKESLRSICESEAQTDSAWNALYIGAVSLIEHRGRWKMAQLLRLLQREGIAIRDADFPAAITSKLASWVRSTHDSFTLTAARKRLPLTALLEMRAVGTMIEQQDAEDAASALERYHDTASALDRDAPIFDAEWTGKFRRQAVVVAGPGLGKSTLMTLLANRYSTDGFPVLSVKLKPIAAAMERGDSFDYALRSQALDGSSITIENFSNAKLSDLVILADGLDDCGSSHEAVARALHAISLGHPCARIIVTTRPIGYTTAALVNWKHYQLLAPKKEHGARNLAKLLSALQGSDETSEDTVELALRNLAASRVAETISRSPHLLGMAAALISSRGNLPDTRPRLYSRLIGLFETADEAGPPCPASSPVSARVLNGLGWLLMHESLASADVLIEDCATLLVKSMGGTQLDMIERVEPVLKYWEKLGLIEQLHHEGAAYWTFVHKTFTEFTAARHLKEMPDEQRTAHLDELLDEPDWHEVIAFAGGLGLGDEIARLLVERRASGHHGQMERALALVADLDAEVTDRFVRELVALAFEAVQAEGEDRFSVGLALSELAQVHPVIVGSIATKHLHDERNAVKLVAWACAVTAEPDSYEADELSKVLSTLLPTVSKGLRASLLGGISIDKIGRNNEDRDLIERIAFAALAAQPNDDLKAFAEAQIGHGTLGTWRYHNKISALLEARGVAEDIEPPWARSTATSMGTLLDPPDEWRHASASAMQALAEAVIAEDGEAGSTGLEPMRFPQLGALVALTGFNKVPAYDVYCWDRPYDAAAVRHVLQALVHASAIDPQALSAEAAAVLRRADGGDELWRFDIQLPNIDVPEPEWHKAAALMSDRATLVAAMNHGSVWMAYVAGSILAASRATPEQSRLLLDDTTGASLWAATEVIREQQPADVANNLILDRLGGSLCDGSEYLFKGLQDGRVKYSPALCEAIRRGLASDSATIAVAAAELAKDLADRGQPLEPSLIVDAYDDWLVREPEQEGSTIPPSPRETLLKLLISQNALDDDRLLATLSDDRSDVRNVGKEHLLDAIATSAPLKDAVIKRMVSRSLTPAFAASVLRREIPMSGDQVLALESLVGEQDREWRRVGVELLRKRYLSTDRIIQYGKKLSTDDEGEIRQAAEQRLASETS